MSSHHTFYAIQGGPAGTLASEQRTGGAKEQGSRPKRLGRLPSQLSPGEDHDDQLTKVSGIESSKTYPYPRGLAGPEIVDFGVYTGPSYRKTHWKGWGASPPTFSSVFCGRRGPFQVHECIGFWARDVTKPNKFIGLRNKPMSIYRVG